MKAHLMHRDQDFNLKQKLPSNEAALIQDLELDTIFCAMGGNDELFLQVSKQAVLTGLENDVTTILYRQCVLKDCLQNPETVKAIYDLTTEAIEGKKSLWFGGYLGRYPGSILYGAIEMMQIFMKTLGKLKALADLNAGKFHSEGFSTFFSMLTAELTDEYFFCVKNHLAALRFRRGVLVSAQLGRGNQGIDYVLRENRAEGYGWIERFFSSKPKTYTFRIADRDEAGAKALGDLKDRGINTVANALAQSADHILNFFMTLRAELAFYLGCLNLHSYLIRRHVPLSFPVPHGYGVRKHSFVRLHDACLALALKDETVGNDLDGDEKKLFVITGANQGGKSTFLRGIGVAQMMMQCGMFVAAESFTADIRRNLFTHYKREEDEKMASGKFDEELDRMSRIIDAFTPDSMFLFNESFAATNEREGSEVAQQIIRGLLGTNAKIFFVTHLYEFAHGLWNQKSGNFHFLRAERKAEGQRTFKLLEGEPLQTSFGLDLYEKIFTSDSSALEDKPNQKNVSEMAL